MRLVVSALACSKRLGSESLVGFRVVEALAGRYGVDVITSAGMEATAGAACAECAVRFDDANDVSAWQLLKFEWRQRGMLRRLLRKGDLNVLHRVTPSGLKDSLLPMLNVPLILGPILLSKPYPQAFSEFFRPTLPRELSLRAAARRVENGIARRVFQHWSTLDQLLAQASMILVGTRTTLERLPAWVRPRCRSVTYAGVEHDVFRPRQRRLPNRVPQLLFVGRAVPYKGLELLLRAAAKANRSCRFELKVIGGGNPVYKKYCEALAATLGIRDSVRFIGNQPRSALVELYQQADAFCMPSIETYGIAILEAMSSGCAVLVSDINGPGEIVQTGTGVKVPLETPEQFIKDYAERLVELVQNSRMRDQLGAAAREHVVRHHDWRDIQATLLDIYDDFFSPRKPTRVATAQETATVRL
jgi:glycosyltransferase involved in cell wall biosynthesis